MFLRRFLLIICFISVWFSSFSQIDSNVIINLLSKKFKHLHEIIPVVVDNDTLANIYNFSNGYAVVSNNSSFYPLKAFSFSGPIEPNSEGFSLFLAMLKKDYLLQKTAIQSNPKLSYKNNISWKKWQATGKIDFYETIGPLLKSEYGQVNCKDENNNYIYVTNYYTPNHYAVGCVALALTTVMRYYNWPINGSGQHSYTDDYGSFKGSYSADFENTTYQWSKIQDKYYKVPSTEEAREALGKVAFHAAISVDMDFESTGSTSNINRIPNAVKKYFRYDLPIYKTVSASNFWNLVDSSIINNSPVQFAVSTSSGAGHAIVCDGIQYTDDPDNKYYHLNMGWWGNSNGWYLIQSSFNAGGYTIIDAAVMGLLPIPQIASVQYDITSNIATIKWYYPDKIENPVFQVQQREGNSDWEILVDNYTDKAFSFSPDLDKTYFFRVKTQDNEYWSEEVRFSPAEELAKYSDINLYPTMPKSKLYIEYKDLRNAKFIIYTLSGKIVYSEVFGNYDGYKKTVDISFLPRGIYIARIITTKKQKSFKLMVEGYYQ